MLLSQPDSPTTNPLSQLAQKMFSDENNSNSEIMLAAIVSLLLVILFVVLLHVYAKWFLAQSQLQSRARRRQPPAIGTGAPGTSHFHHINIETTPPMSTKGLDSATVSAIPTFVCEYETEEAETEDGKTEEFECVICLSVIEEGEIGRRLPKCGHAFHVECIDMWLSSHCNCPICRAPIVVHQNNNQNDSQLVSVHGDDGDFEIVIGTPSYEIGESGSVSVSEETSLSLLLGYTLKRMLSKVFLSSHVNELDGFTMR